MENNEEKDEIFSLLGGVIKGKYELYELSNSEKMLIGDKFYPTDFIIKDKDKISIIIFEINPTLEECEKIVDFALKTSEVTGFKLDRVLVYEKK